MIEDVIVIYRIHEPVMIVKSSKRHCSCLKIKTLLKKYLNLSCGFDSGLMALVKTTLLTGI